LELKAPVPVGDFVTQDGGEDSRTPDIVGRDSVGTKRIVVEAKFWAGLTNHQPVSYVKALSDGTVLAFLVPKARVELVWNELVNRCKRAALAITEVDPSSCSFPHAATVDARVTLILLTWEALLGTIQDALRAANETDRLEDVRQLAGLCARMDSDAFLPLTSQELTGAIWKRVVQLSGMIPAIIARLQADGVVKKSCEWLCTQRAFRQSWAFADRG
jgi:hypothetical protein